ncbi:34794_t:CDS:10, partial [Racocetra persica]
THKRVKLASWAFCKASCLERITFSSPTNRIWEKGIFSLIKEEINQLCQLQTEITSLEIKLEQEQAREQEELVAKIEISSNQKKFLYPLLAGFFDEGDIWVNTNPDFATLNPKLKKILHKLQAQGHKIVFTTGRNYLSALPFYHQVKLDTFLVTYNGAFINNPTENCPEKEKVVIVNPIANQVVKDILNEPTIKRNCRNILIDKVTRETLCTSEDIYYQQVFFNANPYTHGENILQLLGEKDALQLVIELPNEEKELNDILMILRNKYSAAVTFYFGNKLKAAKEGEKVLVPDPDRVVIKILIAFGNDINDIELMHIVGHGVAVADSVPHLKTYAYGITDCGLLNSDAESSGNFRLSGIMKNLPQASKNANKFVIIINKKFFSLLTFFTSQSSYEGKYTGDHNQVVIPVPIPNTEVKHLRDENTHHGEDSSLPVLLFLFFQLKIQNLSKEKYLYIPIDTLFGAMPKKVVGFDQKAEAGFRYVIDPKTGELTEMKDLETLEQREKSRGDRVLGMAKLFYEAEKNFNYAYDLLVQKLIKDQFPEYACLPIRQVEKNGHDNRTFRLGDKMTVRLPSGKGYASQVEKETLWLPKLKQHLSLPIPTPLQKGQPTADYPFPFLKELQAIDASNGPVAGNHNFYRGGD